MSLYFLSIPPKKLSQSITSSSSSFKLNNIKSWKRNALGVNINLASSDFGTTAYGCFRNDTGTKIEIFSFDPATIASSSITILKRGLDFNGDLTTETTNYKLDWSANETTVQLGTDVPQLFQYLKEYVDSSIIAGAVPASTTAAGLVVEASQAEVNAFTDTKVVSSVTYKLIATPAKLQATTANKGIVRLSTAPVSAAEPIAVGDNDLRVANASTTAYGIVEEATQAEVDAGTATGGTGARLFVNPSTITGGFGDGSDGTATISTPTTLSSDKYYTDLTVNSTLTTDGYKIFVSGTLSGSGTIDWGTATAGGQGGNSVGSVGAGGTAGGVTGSGILKNTAGQTGGGGASGASGGDGVAGTQGRIGVAAGDGGHGGDGGVNGGAAATGGTDIRVHIFAKEKWDTIPVIDYKTDGTLLVRVPRGAASGGGGGSNSSPSKRGGGGGGSGASGGIVWIAARTWAGTFTIKAVGGAGGNGGTSSTSGGVGGGGGGGAGGTSIVIYGIKTWSGSYNLAGGVAGVKGTGTDGTSATDGTAGTTGTSYELIYNYLF